MSDILSMLDEEFAEVKDVSFEDVPAGKYNGEITKVTYDVKTWGDGTVVPQVSLQVKINEGDYKGNMAFVNLNLNGKTAEHRGWALQAFTRTVRTLGVDPKDYSSLEDVIEAAIADLVGVCAQIEGVTSGEWTNFKVTGKC